MTNVFQAVKLRQSIYGEEHPVTKRTLDLFTVIYAEMGKEQYSGEGIVTFFYLFIFVVPPCVAFVVVTVPW